MRATLLVITDGREQCLRKTLETFTVCANQMVFDRRVVVNDCPDHDFGVWLDEQDFDEHIRPLGQRRGFAGAVAAGWAAVAGSDFVFHLEDDFMFTRHVDVRAMAEVINETSDGPRLAQVALRRQPWSEEEQLVGGYVEQHPTDYVDCCDHRGHTWMEHRRFFTTNPSLIPGWVIKRGWPVVEHSEGRFSLNLFKDPQVVCGIWGKRADPPWVHHIGNQRVGIGY